MAAQFRIVELFGFAHVLLEQFNELIPSSRLQNLAKLCEWMRQAVEAGASDLHLIPGYPPVLRVHGLLEPIDEEQLLAGGDTDAMLRAICPAEMRASFDSATDLDFSYELSEAGASARFRVNVFLAGGLPGACFRLIPPKIPDFAWAEFSPQLAERLAHLRDGSVVVTGPTGSGKTTTLAMIVQLLNQEGGRRILTVEQPVEYVFSRSLRSLITHGEVGNRCAHFRGRVEKRASARSRCDSRGRDSRPRNGALALSAAETGHLVFTTLHTRDAKGMITRFADLFPQDVQKDIRGQLAMSLRAIVSQRLLPDVEPGRKRHLAVEVLWNNHPIANAIRTGKVESIDNYLLTRRDEGMMSFDESVRRLYEDDKITRATAEQNLTDPAALNY